METMELKFTKIDNENGTSNIELRCLGILFYSEKVVGLSHPEKPETWGTLQAIKWLYDWNSEMERFVTMLVELDMDEKFCHSLFNGVLSHRDGSKIVPRMASNTRGEHFIFMNGRTQYRENRKADCTSATCSDWNKAPRDFRKEVTSSLISMQFESFLMGIG